MNLNTLIPKDKFDIETVEKLKNYPISEIEPIIPDLLTWIQDFNWPVAPIIAEYLQTNSSMLTEHIIEILKGTDEVWKYWTMSVFVRELDLVDQQVMDEVIRIANNPTADEINEEVQDLAIKIINERD